MGIIVCQPFYGESAEDEKRTISVNSEGILQKYPDKARVTYSISTEHTDPAQAYEELLRKLKKFEEILGAFKETKVFEIQKSGVILSSTSPGYSSQRSGDTTFSSMVNYTFVFNIDSPDNFNNDYRSILKFISYLKDENFFPEFQGNVISGGGNIPRVYICYFFSDIDSLKEELIGQAKKKSLEEAQESARLIGIDPDSLRIDTHNINADRLEYNYGDTQMMTSRDFPGVPEYTKVGLSLTIYLTYKTE
ncbi:MAG: SIMPL domain-containing protein [Verrucomicrobia bacterium]|nr:SIMPL domain-containing protein [Verrucomicrobiota bacterium]